MKVGNRLKSSNNGKKIKIRLIELGVSQAELAKEIGASSIYMNHIISGYRPGDKYIEAIEAVLGINLEGIREDRFRLEVKKSYEL